MVRAKYNGDPRICPACGKKRLYARMVCIGLPGSTGEPEEVYADRCNDCRRDFFDGEIMKEGDPRLPPTPEQVRVRVRCLLHNAAISETRAKGLQNEADRMRALATALEAKGAAS